MVNRSSPMVPNGTAFAACGSSTSRELTRSPRHGAFLPCQSTRPGRRWVRSRHRAGRALAGRWEGGMGAGKVKAHAGDRMLKDRYFALRSALRDLADYSPHIGRTRDKCAPSCPACEAEKALVRDAAHGRIVDDRPRGGEHDR